MRETEVLHKLKAENIHQAPLLLKATHFQKCNSYCEVRQYLVCIVLFIVLLLLSKQLESVCRQVSNSHANYRQPWHLLALITFLVQHCSLFLFLTNFIDWQQANLRQLVREYSFFHSNQPGGCQPGSRPMWLRFNVILQLLFTIWQLKICVCSDWTST